jgi:hypothetical protein
MNQTRHSITKERSHTPILGSSRPLFSSKVGCICALTQHRSVLFPAGDGAEGVICNFNSSLCMI